MNTENDMLNLFVCKYLVGDLERLRMLDYRLNQNFAR
jgi:hypothetical protein